MGMFSKIITGIVTVSAIITAIAAVVRGQQVSPYISSYSYNPCMNNMPTVADYNSNNNNKQTAYDDAWPDEKLASYSYQNTNVRRGNGPCMPNINMDDYGYGYGYGCTTGYGYNTQNVSTSNFQQMNTQNAFMNMNCGMADYNMGGVNYNSGFVNPTSYNPNVNSNIPYGYGVNPQMNTTTNGFNYGYNNTMNQPQYGGGGNYIPPTSYQQSASEFLWNDINPSDLYNYNIPSNPQPQQPYSQPNPYQQQSQHQPQQPTYHYPGFEQPSYPQQPNHNTTMNNTPSFDGSANLSDLFNNDKFQSSQHSTPINEEMKTQPKEKETNMNETSNPVNDSTTGESNFIHKNVYRYGNTDEIAHNNEAARKDISTILSL